MKPLLFALLPLAMNHAFAAPPSPPPPAPVREVVDEYHGTKIADPYRYLENLKDPETLGWMKAQSAYAQAVIDAIPGRAKLLERIKALDQGAPYRVHDVVRLKDGTIFYQKFAADAEVGVVCSRSSETGEEKVVLTPKTYEGADGKHASLEFFAPSPDGRYVLAGISKGGSEITTLTIHDNKTGKDLPEAIDRIETAYNVPQWLPDSSGFLYSRRRKLADDAPATETYKNTTAFRHLINPDPPTREDRPIFGLDLQKDIPFAPLDFPSAWVFPNSKYLIGQIHHGDSQELTLYTMPWDSLGLKTFGWTKICDARDEVISYTVHGDYVYLVTSKDAPRYQVVRTPLAKPDFAKAEVVLPESEIVPSSLAASKSHVFVNASKAGIDVIVQLDPSGQAAPERLTPPKELYGYVAEASAEFEDIYVSTKSWTKGGGLYRYAPAKKEFQASPLQPKGAFDDLPGFVSKEVEVKSHDGALVPLSIIYKEGLALDGSHPLLLNGYGAYGMIQYAGFRPTSLAWLERGGIIAVAHVRGGGERGKPWHLGGQKATKPNTWKDFIACAEYLVAQKYTSPAKLAIQGGSAGGILIGRTITERPDLFRAAIINVGLSDTLRFETTENGPPNVEEFGSVATPEGFKALLEMSPLHQVKDGVKYPAVLLTHGLNDRRVDAWMSAKMTARLQAATRSGNPVLFLLDTDAGHGIGSMRTQVQEQTASKWSFLLWQMEEAGFQPEK